MKAKWLLLNEAGECTEDAQDAHAQSLVLTGEEGRAVTLAIIYYMDEACEYATNTPSTYMISLCLPDANGHIIANDLENSEQVNLTAAVDVCMMYCLEWLSILGIANLEVEK